MTRAGRSGFTIVELLIVIIVIGILATLVLVAYSNVQSQARTTKIKNDLTALRDAVYVARTNQTSLKTMGAITGSFSTAANCESQPNGTDLAALPKTDGCWVAYNTALSNLAAASGASNLVGMTDPWGRPYFIDENEGEGSSTNCGPDQIGAFPFPMVNSSWSAMSGTSVAVKAITPGC